MKFKKVTAIALSVAMVLGSNVVALADGSASGTGNLEGYVDPTIVHVSVPQVATGTFNFKADPQKLIYNTVNGDGEAKAAYANATVDANATLLFKKSVAAADAEETFTPKTAPVTDPASYDISITGNDYDENEDATYVYDGTASRWKVGTEAKDVTIVVKAVSESTDVDFATGDKITVGEDGALTFAPTSTITNAEFVISGVATDAAAGDYVYDDATEKFKDSATELGAITGETIAVSYVTKTTVAFADEDKVEHKAAIAATDQYSNKSEEIVCTNTGLNDISVAVEAKVTPSTNIKVSDTDTFANDKTASVYLALEEKVAAGSEANKAAVKKKTENNVDSYTAKLTGSIDKLAANQVDYTYDDDEGYTYIVKQGVTPNTFTFYLTGAANPNGNWSNVGTTEAPKVDITWKFTDPTANDAYNDAYAYWYGSDNAYYAGLSATAAFPSTSTSLAKVLFDGKDVTAGCQLTSSKWVKIPWNTLTNAGVRSGQATYELEIVIDGTTYKYTIQNN